MPLFRQRLAWVFGGWIVFQVAGAVAPIALAAGGDGTMEEVCTCPGGGHGAACPMHHGERPAARSAERDDPRRCVMRGASAGHDLALLSFSIAGGPPPPLAIVQVPTTAVGSVAVSDASLSSRDPLPAAPPPRA